METQTFAAPMTRWVGGPPWLRKPAPVRSAAVAVMRVPAEAAAIQMPGKDATPAPARRAAMRKPAAPATTREVLLSLVERELKRGYGGAAARHFLMLKACDLPVPRELGARCEQWLAQCKEARRLAIVAQVKRWAEMVLPAGAPDRNRTCI